MNIDVQTVTTGATPYLKIDIQIDRSELSISETQMGTRLRLENWPRVGKTNGPDLPRKAVSIALPLHTSAGL